MATITTDTYLDGGTARTAGEAWTCNGGKLLIRTDSRWHANAPASMTGSLGSVTISSTLGGGYEIDASNVRWLAITGGSGTAAIGDTISQGGVSGYFLGYWSSLSAAPSLTIGATGFIKFREVTGGTFAAGALTFSGGGAATAAGADVQGWIEVVHRTSSNLTFPRLGTGFKSRGGWFYLDNTNGSRGQQIQTPTNGGGAGTIIPAVQIETSPGSGVYRWYKSLTVARGWTTANLGTDSRSRFVEAMSGGIIRIGSDGTNNIGDLPASGCKVRIPNVIGRQCTPGTDATNNVPNTTVGTRPEFVTTAAGAIDIEYFMTDWYCNFVSTYSCSVKHFCVADIINVTNCATAPVLENGCNGAVTTLATLTYPLQIVTCVNGGTLNGWEAVRPDTAASGYIAYFNNFSGWTINNVRGYHVATARNATSFAVRFDYGVDSTINSTQTYGHQTSVANCSRLTINDTDTVDRLVGTTDATTGLRVISVNASADILVDGLSWGENATYADVQPYAGLVNTTTCFGGIRIRNAGTKAVPLNAGSSGFFYPAYTYQSGGNEIGITVQRLYVNYTRTLPFTVPNTSKGVNIEHVYGNLGQLQTLNAINATVKGCGADRTATGQSSVYGSHWMDVFNSDTTGKILMAGNEPTAETASLVTLTLGGLGGFTSGGSAAMPTLGDTLVVEMPSYIKGHTGFQNTAPTLTGVNTGNFTIEYQIDVNDGTGWGAWTALSGANLSSETVGPADGFKLKIRVTTATALDTNAITYIAIDTTSSAAAQENNLYTLDENFITIDTDGLLTDTRVQIYNVTQATEIANEMVTTGEFSMTFDTLLVSALAADGDTIRIRACKLGYLGFETVGVFSDVSGLTFLISQEIDDVYTANGVDGTTVTEFALDLPNIEIDLDDPDGKTTLQRGYAWYNYILTTELGISGAYGGFTAVDEANYVAHGSVLDFHFDNVNVLPLHMTGGYVYRDDGQQIISATSGSIFIDAGKAYLANGSTLLTTAKFLALK